MHLRGLLARRPRAEAEHQYAACNDALLQSETDLNVWECHRARYILPCWIVRNESALRYYQGSEVYMPVG